MTAKVDPWVHGILCDPVSKSPLRLDRDFMVSDYGRRYPVVEGVYDLRALTSRTGLVSELWHLGQGQYEVRNARATRQLSEAYYAAQRRGVEEVYRDIRISGRCVDVGGSDGSLRAFLDPQQEYISIDPWLELVREPRSRVAKLVYPFIDEPLNFIAAFAEHLPFLSWSFDVVHMRSVLDHFLNPELAVREAFRVLKNGGSIVIGLYVKGGKSGRVDMRTYLKEMAREMLVAVGVNRVRDHHMWHPTYKELCQLITTAGFCVERTHWQKSEQDRVCYIQAFKCVTEA